MTHVTTPQEQAHGTANKSEELCLLSLDGGGVRGLSSLQVLKQLMELIDPKNPPKPCDYFDIIGGTSTGGLIAIMLGRLRLSVDECIEEYKTLSDKVFTKLHHRATVNGKIRGRFDHEALVAGVQKLLERKGFSRDELLKDDSENGCKTFVCTTSKETSDTVVLTSYYTQRWGTDMLNKTKIWEAARATSAATSFFDPMTIGSETFVDGATGANNPIQELIIEANNLWNKKRPSWRIEDNLQCVVSVGTGIPSLMPFGDKLWDVPQTLLAIATDTERTAEKWQRSHDTLFREKRAFRFNVISGLENIGLEDAKRQGEILAATKRYIALQNVLDQMNDCAANLQTRQCLSYAIGTADIQHMLPSKGKALGDGVWQKDALDSIMHASEFQTWCQKPGGIIWCVTKTQDRPQDRLLAAYLAEKLSSQFTWNSLYYAFQIDSRRILRKEQLKQEAHEGKGSDIERQLKQEGAAAVRLFRHLIVQMRTVGDPSTETRFSKLSSHDRALLKNSTADNATLKDQMSILIQLFQLTGRRNVIFLECIDVLDSNEIKELLPPLRLLLGNQSVHVSVLISGYPEPDIISQMTGIPTITELTEYSECLETLEFQELYIRRAQVTDAEPGTNHWIWSHPAYLRFKRERSGILWIEGKPGSGKSVLAKTIQRDLRASPCHPSCELSFRIGDWFYHRRRGGAFASHQSALRSMLYQLLESDPKLFHYFRETHRQRYHDTLSGVSWNYNTLLTIFENMSRDGIEMLCVLDALDEAQDVKILELFERVIVQYPLSRTKFIILSRGNVEIERVLRKYHHILLEEENTADISRFIESGKISLSKAMHALDFESEVQVKPSRSGIPRNSRPLRAPRQFVSRKVNDQEKQELESIGEYIRDRAKGTFLWVKLVFDQLHTEVERGIGTFAGLRKRLKECPEKLTDYYHHIIINLHCDAPERNVQFARTALMWVSGASELAEFTLEELWDALAISLEEEDDQDQDNVQDLEERGTDRVADRRIPIRSFHEFRRKIHGICGPLVEVLKPSTLNEHSEFTIYGGQFTVQLMHQTVKDFLSQPRAAGHLHFYPHMAIEMVKRLCRRYVELVEATVPKLLADATYTLGVITAAKIVEWLDDQKLLRFALNTQPKWEHREISVFEQIFCNAIAPPEPNTMDWEFVSALMDYRYADTEKLSPQAISAGRLFHLACSEGFVVAASNLIAITSCLPGWWKTNCRVVKHAAMLAAAEVNTSSLILRLHPGTVFETESPQRVDDSPETPWISSEWTATLEKHSTTKPEVEFSTDSRFENWCSLLDKICGGRAYMLRSKRKNLYVQDELPNVEDVEEAIWVVLQKLGQVD